MADNQRNSEQLLCIADVFRKNAFIIIDKMVELSMTTETTGLVSEILHSIFFLGELNTPPINPAMILGELEDQVRARYPEPFERRSSQLPRRSPFSCVLDMIVSHFGENNEEKIKTTLQEFIVCLCLCPCDLPTPAQKISHEVFTGDAKIITNIMLEPSTTSGKTPALVSQILHSIFFLGYSRNPHCTPENILGERIDEVRERYPEPFQRYLSEEPIPCVLEMINHLIGQNNEEKIKGGLQELIQKLKKWISKKILLSSTVCVSQVQNDSVRYYGVSMSTFPGKAGSQAREIMIAASCLGLWHEYVAGAVMTYCPHDIKKNDFDGTIEVPESIRCEAFSLTHDCMIKEACRSCHNLFGLNTTQIKEWPYGNCAEPESLSKLLKSEEEVKNHTRVHQYSPENWQKAKTEVLKELTNMLKGKNFKWTGDFYEPFLV